ncbi:hypothetical protein MSAN_02074400 [Mycena sanguinolenta]|uniref:Uncharacterized protein n=1 Tax=Mycena sanguinolenta TaxID=230812 RepID=A0A8H7CMS5_9AGAR|nr:hypothetical protein MSAN_02074400 [Mycena sanguinolenta]
MGDRLIRYDFDASLQTHCNLLKALPNLEEARIRRRFDEGGHWPEPGEPVNVLNLRRLYVNNPIIFNYLRAPALEELAIQLESTSTDRDIAAGCGSLEGFLMRSSCSPRRLVIDGVFPAQSTAAILQKHPSFTEIAVIDPLPDEDISAFLALFTISDSTQSESVFPHINNLGFACCNADGDAILYPLFLDMLNSRASVGRPALKVAELLFTNSSVQPDPLSATRLETLRESALQLSLLFEGDARSRVDEWLHNAEWCSLFPSRLG